MQNYADEIERDLKGTALEQEAREYAARLRETEHLTPAEMASLYPEIRVMRLNVLEGMKIQLEAKKLTNAEDLSVRSLSLKMSSAVIIDNVKVLQKLAESAAKIDSINKTSTSIQVARSIIDHACKLAELMFPQFPNLVEKYCMELRSSCRVHDDTVNPEIDRTHIRQMQEMDSFTGGEDIGVQRF